VSSICNAARFSVSLAAPEPAAAAGRSRCRSVCQCRAIQVPRHRGLSIALLQIQRKVIGILGHQHGGEQAGPARSRAIGPRRLCFTLPNDSFAASTTNGLGLTCRDRKLRRHILQHLLNVLPGAARDRHKPGVQGGSLRSLARLATGIGRQRWRHNGSIRRSG